MMSLSDDTTNSQLALNGATVKQNVHHDSTNGEAVVTPDGTLNTASEPRCPSPAWLSREPSQSSAKVKLPPVTIPVNKKKKQKRDTNKNPKHNSKGKLNVAIEPLHEESNEPNVNA